MQWAAARAEPAHQAAVIGVSSLPWWLFSLFLFLLIRPQQKKQKEQKAMLSNLAYGDTVITTGGIYGKVSGLADTVITLEIADKVRIKVARSAIGTILKPGAPAPKE